MGKFESIATKHTSHKTLQSSNSKFKQHTSLFTLDDRLLEGLSSASDSSLSTLIDLFRFEDDLLNVEGVAGALVGLGCKFDETIKNAETKGFLELWNMKYSKICSHIIVHYSNPVFKL